MNSKIHYPAMTLTHIPYQDVTAVSDWCNHSRFTEESFQKLCFDFGIELDGDTENDPSRPKDQAPELAIEIPANRYDMLCFEGGFCWGSGIFRERLCVLRHRG